MEEYSKEVEVLNAKWHNNELDDDTYWDMIDKLKENKPLEADYS